MKEVQGGITAPQGFTASGVRAGIRRAGKPDLALIVSDRPAAVAGVFTANRVQAAPVRLCRERLAGKTARAIVVNSGNANACTGTQGRADAERMAALVAERLGVPAHSVFVCSTGPIGVPLPMDKVASGIEAAVQTLSRRGAAAAAEAILTTDTADKQAAVEILVEGRPVRVAGMAKGAGMIDPCLATMLAFLTSDATVDADSLQTCLRAAADKSFNRISVDGDQSTNDTVLALANGAAGAAALAPGHAAWEAFTGAVDRVCGELALRIVADGEGATKQVSVCVTGAASDAEARRAARAIANSLLVKTSWFGGDPNWGRLMAAVGRSGAQVAEERVTIRFDDVTAVSGGVLAAGVSLKDLAAVYARRQFTLSIDLNLGTGRDTVRTCDCSTEYVRVNSEYMT